MHPTVPFMQPHLTKSKMATYGATKGTKCGCA